LPLTTHFLEIQVIYVDHFLLILHFVWTERALTMKTILLAVYSLAIVLLIGQANAWSQVPWATAPTHSHKFGHTQRIAPAFYCGGCGDVAGTCDCHSSGRQSLLSGLLGGGTRLGNSLNGAGGVFEGMAESGGWIDAEYLLWWSKQRFIPPLATTSPDGTPENEAGHLGGLTTTILFGDELIGENPDSGFRFSTGKWLDQRKTLGIGGRYYTVNNQDAYFKSSSINSSPILTRPFFNTETNDQDALLVAYPGRSHGHISIIAENELRGFDFFLRKLLIAGYGNRLDLIGGYQNSRIKDSVDVRDTLISDDPTLIPLGSQIETQDFFEVRNQFDGGFVGFMASAEDGCLSWRMLGKIAFGNMNQQANISGSTTSSVPGAGSSSDPFGLLALPSNIGSFDRDEFAMVPELNVSVGYNVTNNFKLTLGYSFIYWTEVALAGDMIDTTINPSQLSGPLAGPARPSTSLASDGFWYSGLSLGGNLRF